MVRERTGQVNRWEAELAADAAQAAAELPVTGGTEWVSIKNNRLSYQGAFIPNDTMDVIVLGYLKENKYYAKAYDAGGDNSAPVCYAFGLDDKTMAPHPDADDPQADSCLACPHNQWGSAGKGKACKNVLRIAMIAAEADNIPEAEIANFTIPRTSVKAFNAYVKQLADTAKRPPYAAVTRMSLDPKAIGAVKFELVKLITGEAIGELLEKRKSIRLDNPYQKHEKTETKQPETQSRFGNRNRKL